MFNLRFLITVILISAQSLIFASAAENNIHKTITSSPNNQALAVTHLPVDLQKIIFNYLSEYTPTVLVKADQNFSIIDSSLSLCGRYLTTIAINFKALEAAFNDPDSNRRFDELMQFVQGLGINNINDIAGFTEILMKSKEKPEIEEGLKKLILEFGNFILEELPHCISIRITQLDTNKAVDYPVAKLLDNCKVAVLDFCEEVFRQLKSANSINELMLSAVLNLKLGKIMFAYQACFNLLTEILEMAPSLLGAEILSLKSKKNGYPILNRNASEKALSFIFNHFKPDKAAISNLINGIKCIDVLRAQSCGRTILNDPCVDSARAVSSDSKYVAWAFSNRTVDNPANEILGDHRISAGLFLGMHRAPNDFQRVVHEIFEDKDKKSVQLTNKFIVKIYDVASDQIKKDLHFEKQVEHMAISANNKYLAIACDQRLLIYDLCRDQIILQSDLTDRETVTYLKFGATDTVLNTHMKGGQVKILDLNTGKITELIDENSLAKNIVTGALINKHNTVSYSQNGQYLACEQGDTGVQVFANQSYELQRSERELNRLLAESNNALKNYFPEENLKKKSYSKREALLSYAIAFLQKASEMLFKR